MFDLKLKEDDILMEFTVRKIVTTKDVINNFIGNLITPAGGDIADKVKVILTKEYIYLEYTGHVSLGYAEEIREVDKIAIKDIEDFLVEVKEKEELIKIKTAKKEFEFIRDNKNYDNLGLAMSKVLNDIK